MQSNGGIIAADVARDRPVRTLLSGPAAGVQGATAIAKRCGFEDVITMDMGGTSCDVSLVEDSEPVVSTDVAVGPYPVGVPMIDVHTVGSGGGSIAWIDAGGALRVGPRSAGADPGLDLRYAGQTFELSVPIPEGTIDERSLETVAERFHKAHRQRYGHAYEEESIELVTIRLRARSAVDPPSLAIENREESIEDAIVEPREVIYDGEAHDTRIYDGTRLPVGANFEGPAVIEGAQSTTVLPPGQRITVDEYGTLLVEVFPDE